MGLACQARLRETLSTATLGKLMHRGGRGMALTGTDAHQTARNPQEAPGAAGPGAAGPGATAATPSPLPRAWAVPAAALGGLALAGAFPPIGVWPLAPLGPTLLVVALWRRNLRSSFALGLVFGLALFVPLLSWLVNVAWYVWLALAVAEAVVFGLLCIGQQLLLRLPAWPIAVAGWWVMAEALRARWPYAFPWGRLAMSQAGAPTAAWAALGGAPLLSFLLALAGATLAWLLLSARRRPVLPVLTFAAATGLLAGGALLPAGPVAGDHSDHQSRERHRATGAKRERRHPARP